MATEFLEKAIRLNPQSHYGSEWIHLKILQEKTKPFPQFRNIIDLKNEDDFVRWPFDNSIAGDKLVELKKQLFYQLKERISFVPAPDAVVGQLLVNLGDLERKSNNKDLANQYYQKALEYAPTLAPVIGERQNISPVKLFFYKYKALVITGGIILLIGLYIIFRRNRRIYPQDYQTG